MLHSDIPDHQTSIDVDYDSYPFFDCIEDIHNYGTSVTDLTELGELVWELIHPSQLVVVDYCRCK